MKQEKRNRLSSGMTDGEITFPWERTSRKPPFQMWCALNGMILAYARALLIKQVNQSYQRRQKKPKGAGTGKTGELG